MCKVIQAMTTPELIHSSFFILYSNEGLTPPSRLLCRPDGLLENGKMKRKKKSGLTFYEGLTPPSLLLFRPLGLLENGKMKRKKKSGLTFNEGLTPPSLSLYRPLGLFCKYFFVKSYKSFLSCSSQTYY